MANCTERTLRELFSDNLSDSEVKESKFKAEVVNKDSSSEVKVSDGETTITVTFAPDTNKLFANTAVMGARLTFYNLEKQGPQSLIFSNSSVHMCASMI